MKTLDGWEESGLLLDEYLQVGDIVDEELQLYFLEVLPPATMTDRCIQIGEPSALVDGAYTYDTLKKTKDGWVYCGECHQGKTVRPSEGTKGLEEVEMYMNGKYVGNGKIQEIRRDRR